MKKQTIEIRVEGGLISTITGIPKGIRIKVLDFDVDGTEQAGLSIVDGQECVESIYTTDFENQVQILT